MNDLPLPVVRCDDRRAAMLEGLLTAVSDLGHIPSR